MNKEQDSTFPTLVIYYIYYTNITKIIQGVI